MNAPQPFPDAADEPGVFEVEDAALETLLDAAAEADIAAGRVVSHEAVARWLNSKWTDHPLPRPQWGE